jgi:hypothetical protein
MIKSPITKTGELRYFELIKIIVLLSFLYAIIADILNLYSSTLSTMSITTSYVVFGMILVQLLIVNLSYFNEIWSILHQLVVNLVKDNRVLITYEVDILKTIESKIQYKNVSYLTLSVIRC